MCPSLPLYLPQTSLVKFPFTLIYYQLLLFRTILTTPSYPHLKTAVLQFNHLCMWVEAGGGFWGVEAKTTHYIMYLLFQGC